MSARSVSIACIALAASLAAAGSLHAQNARASATTTRAAGPRQRAQLEQRLRQRIGVVVRKRLQLTDAQFNKLSATNSEYEGKRQELVRQERATRVGLRAEILAGDHADQQHVAALIDRLVQLQRQRLDLLAREQEELAHFMTPVQRAQYMAIEEQVQRRVEQLRQSAPRGRRRNTAGAATDSTRGAGGR